MKPNPLIIKRIDSGSGEGVGGLLQEFPTQPSGSKDPQAVCHFIPKVFSVNDRTEVLQSASSILNETMSVKPA